MKAFLGAMVAKYVASTHESLAYLFIYALACSIALLILYFLALLAIPIYRAATKVPSGKLYAFFSALYPLALGWLSIAALLIAIPLGSHDGKWFSLFHKPGFESDFIDCVGRDARKDVIAFSEREAEESISFWRKQIDISVLEHDLKIRKLRSEHIIFVRQHIDTHPDLVETSGKLLAHSLQIEAQFFAETLHFAREQMKKTSLDNNQKIAKLRELSTRQYCYEHIFERSITGINWYYEHYSLKSTYRRIFHGETKEFWENTLSGAL